MPMGKIRIVTNKYMPKYSKNTKPVTKKIKAYVKKAVDRKLETNYVDRTVTLTALVAGTSQFHHINPTSQGDQVSNRAGNTIRMKAVQLRIAFVLKKDAVDTYGKELHMFRLMLVVDKQPNNAIFASTALLETDAIMSFRNRENAKRFQVLYDKVITVDPNSAPTSVTNVGDTHYIKFITINKSLKDLKVEYDGNAGTIADINKNSLYLMVTNSDIGAVEPHNVIINSRLLFKD